MSQRPTQVPADLQDHWPEDAGNEELDRFARDLMASKRELAPIALDRIQVRMRQEMGRVERKRKLRTMAAVGVALLAMSVGVWKVISMRTGGDVPVLNEPARGMEKLPVQDRYEVVMPPASPRGPEKGLIDLEREGTLFGSHSVKKDEKK